MENKPTIKFSVPNPLKYWPFFALLLIIALSMYIRLVGFYNPDGTPRWPYLRNIDSYNYFRDIEDIVKNGFLPSYNPLAQAPYGVGTPGAPGSCQIYTCLAAYSYSFYKIFSPATQLWEFLIWFPALLASLIAIPMYYLGKTLFDKKAGLLAAIFMIFSPPVISRTLGGDPDSDAIVLLLTMAAMAAYVVLYRNMDKIKLLTKKNIFLGLFAGFWMALFSYMWAYWFALWIIVAFIVLKVFTDFILTKHYNLQHLRSTIAKNKSMVGTFAIFLIGFYIFAMPYHGPSVLLGPIQGVLGSFSQAEAIKGETGQFPNVYVSVAELQVGGGPREVAIRAAGVDTAANVTNMPLSLLVLFSPFILSILCFAYLAYCYYKRRDHLDTLIFLGVWFGAALYASVFAVRFSIFLAPVFAIASAVILSKFLRLALVQDKVIDK